MALSPSRTRHRFVEEAGVPLKRYVLWRRLRMACIMRDAGASATRAAHDTGFSDAAHLARTFRAMFGSTVTRVLA